MTQPRTACTDDRVVNTQADEVDERLLLQRLAQGDRRAFWSIWMRHQEELFSRCLHWLGGNRAEAEDALSSASLKAWKHLPAHAQDIVNVKGWLIRLLYNHCIDIRRTLKRHHHIVQGMTTLPHPRLEWQPPAGELPEEIVSYQEALQDVRYAIDSLPHALHETVELRFFHDLSYREIAIQLNLSPENARKRVQKARSFLRASLTENCSSDHRLAGMRRPHKGYGHAERDTAHRARNGASGSCVPIGCMTAPDENNAMAEMGQPGANDFGLNV